MGRKIKGFSIILMSVIIAGIITGILTRVIDLPMKVDHILSRFLDPRFGGTTNLSYEIGSNGESIHESYFTLPVDTPFDVSVELIQADVMIEKSKNGELGVKISTDRPEHYRMDRTDRELVIKEKKQPFIWPFGDMKEKKAKITIQVPGDTVDFDLETVNGNVCLEADGRDLNVEVVNGQISVTRSTFKEGELELVNGHIFVNKSEFLTSLDLEAVNGALKVNQVDSDEFSFETVNGEFQLSDLDGGRLSAETVNGDFTGENLYLKHLEVEQLTGKFTLINENLDYQVQSLTRSKTSSQDKIEANILNIYSE